MMTQGAAVVDAGETIAAQLERFIAERLGPGAAPRVGSVQRVATGRSRENWLFELSWSDPTGPRLESLIARRDPDGGLLETERATEFAILQALEATSVPAPQARWLDADGAALGKPSLVMVRLPGTCEYYLINGVWEAEHLFARYEAVTGIAVDRDSVRWWNTFSSYKTAVMQVSGLRSFVEGRSDELYQPSAAVLMHLLDAAIQR